MNDRREQIQRSLQKLIERRRAFEFQTLAFHLLKNHFPALQSAEWNHDGGEDAFTLPVEGSDGIKRSFACSLTATLTKVKKDCRRIQERGVCPDIVLFVTSEYVERTKSDEWKKEIRKEFGHELEVLSRNAIVTDLERPENNWLCRDYLDLPVAESPNVDTLISLIRTTATQSLTGWKSQYRYESHKLIEFSLRQNTTSSGTDLRHRDAADLCEQLRGGRS